ALPDARRELRRDLGSEHRPAQEHAELGKELLGCRRLAGDVHAGVVAHVGAGVEEAPPERCAVVGETHLVGAKLAALLVGQAELDDTGGGVGFDVEVEAGAGGRGHDLLDCTGGRGPSPPPLSQLPPPAPGRGETRSTSTRKIDARGRIWTWGRLRILPSCALCGSPFRIPNTTPSRRLPTHGTDLSNS